MRKILILLSVLCSLTVSAQSTSETAFTIKEPDLIPECIVYSETKKKFFIGSLLKRKIISVDETGSTTLFTNFDASGIKAVAGIKIDQKKNELYALNSQARYKSHNPPVNAWMTGIFRYDIRSGKLLENVVLGDTKSRFNDLCLDTQGNVYITDSNAGAIYLKRANENSLQLLFDTATFKGPNGILFYQSKLFVATIEGIFVIDQKTKSKQLLIMRDGENAGQIDGLYMHKNSLIGIQNGTKPKRIIRIDLADKLTDPHVLKVLEQHDEPFNIFSPTTGTIVGDYFYYISNAQIRSIDRDENILLELKPVIVKKIKLK